MIPADLPERLGRFLDDVAPTSPGDAVVVAHSGGADSTALLAALCSIAPRRGLRVLAAHLDHALVPGSAARAEAACELARRLGAEPLSERRPVPRLAHAGESPEAAARRVRYRFLEEVRHAHGARWIATAHHRDDQAETLVLRMLRGSGLEGLSGILPRRGHVVRPLLDVPRNTLHDFLGHLDCRLEILEDPSNRELSIPRNRVRRILLPHLGSDLGDLSERLARLAAAACGARAAIERRLTDEMELSETADRLPLDRFRALPEPLVPFALALLHRRAGAPHPAGRDARTELLRQLRDPGSEEMGVDAGGGWRWERREGALVLGEAPPHRRAEPFSYRLPAPRPRGAEGALETAVRIEEIDATLRLRRQSVAPWMFRGSRYRAALALPADGLDSLAVRSRRPGDRLRPLGAPGERKLKDVLIDRRVPRRDRDRLPLLTVGGRIAWVPGVTVDESFRLPARLREGHGEVWTVELEPER